MAEWPSDLPMEPMYDGFQEVPPRTVLRTTMDAGPVKVRRRYTANIRLIKCRFSLTKDEVAILDLFFTDVAEGGSVPFTWTHPRTGDAVLARFGTEPRYTIKSADLYIAEIELEVLPGTPE